MSKDRLNEYAKGADHDRRPAWAEFVAPKLMFERTVDKTLGELARSSLRPHQPWRREPPPTRTYCALNDATGPK